MRVILLKSVEEFIQALEHPIAADVRRIILLLEQSGHRLSMPYAKPIGHGLWELRRTGRPQIRILYGFCKGDAILVLGIVKKRRALQQKDVARAAELLLIHCG